MPPTTCRTSWRKRAGTSRSRAVSCERTSEDGASEQEIRKRLDDLEQEAREEGQAAEKDFQELRKDLENELP